MAKINGIELKAIKTFTGTEGTGFSANIYVDGKKAGHVSDAAYGGCYNYDYDDTEHHNIVKEKIKEHYEKYPEIDTLKIYETPIDTIDMNNLPRQAYQDMFEPDDCFFSDLLNLALREKDYKKNVKKGYTVMVCIDFLQTKCPTPLPISFACTPTYDYNKDFENAKEKHKLAYMDVYNGLEDFIKE